MPSWEEAGQKGGSLVGVKRHHTRTGLKGWKGDENRPQEGGRGQVCIIGGRECESGVWVRWVALFDTALFKKMNILFE